MTTELFRMPSTELHRQYIYWPAAFVGGGVVAFVIGARFPIGLVAILVAVFLFAVSVAYAIARQRVWVTVSPEGIQGRGIGGRKATIEWSVPVIVARVSPPWVRSIRGITLLQVGDDGAPITSKSVFVPTAICKAVSFQAIVQRVAPAGHALLAEVTRAL